MATEVEDLLDLLDYFWFSHQIFSKTQNNPPFETHSQNIDFSGVPNINIRSDSDHLCIKSKTLISTDSLQTAPKLETIFSGKEAAPKEKVNVKKVARKRKSKSKSLSELEFEEVKGFINLGFMFSEKDKQSSSLVSIIPGLQRLGKENEILGHVSTPYLSQAWDDDFDKTCQKIIRILAFGNELEIKHQLRFWAHSVASAVK